ncbi:MAG: glycosyl hydrolase family 30, partial [Flavobacteriaceae bacterium]|nr:glycosyl hydrolase family 30 [Flavobacteriaceae bacterium]
VDPESDEVYFTPLYYTLSHFSRFIRPGAVRIGFENSDPDLMVTAARNPDGSIAVVVLNMNHEAKPINLALADKDINIAINAKAVQTIIINK